MARAKLIRRNLIADVMGSKVGAQSRFGARTPRPRVDAGLWTKSASERGSVTRSIVICKKWVELLRKLQLHARLAAGHRRALRFCPEPRVLTPIRADEACALLVVARLPAEESCLS